MPQKSIYFGDTFQKAGKKGRQVFRQAPMYRGDQPGPLSNRANTNSPMEFQTQRNYSQTFGGPIQLDENLWRGAQNQGMAQAAFVGNARGYQNQTARQGVRAGNKMQAYSSGTMGNAAENASARLGFQERQAGERGWLRDLMLDRDDVNTRTQMADYKREIDRQLAMRQREVDNAISARQREAMIMSSLMRGMGGLLGGLV
jgi:hypothetical protein